VTTPQKSIVLGLYLRGEQPRQDQYKTLDSLRKSGMIQRQWPRWLWRLTADGTAHAARLCNPPDHGQPKVPNAKT
jgi:hypothetical protein